MSERWDSVSKWMHSKTEVSDKLTVKRVTKIMMDLNIGSVIVTSTEEDNGMLTERDIMLKIIIKSLDPNRTLVQNIASKPLLTIEDNKSIWDAATIMAEHHIRRLPVTNKEGKIIGIITTRSISDALPIISRFKESQELLSALKKMKHQE